jgi:hypothetical protein
MISNADKIAKDPWSAVGYFTSGAIGGMLSVTNPLAGGAFTTNMNIVTDIAFGNVPVISNTSDAVSYLGFKVLDGVGAAGTGQLVKGLFNFIGITSWSNTATLTGAAHLTEPGTSILKGVTGPTVGIEVAKKATIAPVWSLADEVVTNAAKKGANIGTKLEYVFGKATGSAHNIERSTGMLRQLESVGIFDNAAGRSLMNSHLESVYSGTKGILQTNGRYLRESLLMGPRGGLKVESIWEGNKLISVILLGGK